MQEQTLTLQDGTQLDPKVVKVMRAIRDVESKGDYNAVGDNGTSHGAYQFHAGNWKSWAGQYLGDSNAPMTKENQNKLMYARISDQKAQGLNPDEIAALHNGAKKDLTTGQYTYINPQYGERFRSALQEQSGGFNPHPYSSSLVSSPQPSEENTDQPQEKGLGNELKDRASSASNALQDTVSGKINPLSGVLQTVGAGAGAVTDVANAGLKLIPGVKQAEDLLGKGVGYLANTGAGKKVVGGINDFSQAHPELSGDIGAAGNILGAAGVFTGAGAAKDIAGGLIGKALGRDATSVAEKELSEVASRTVGGRKVLQENPEAVKILSQKEFKPTIQDGKYVTKDSQEALDNAISKLDEEMLQPLLENNNTSLVSERLPLETYRQTAIGEAKDSLIDESGINKLFDRIQGKYGDYPSLSQMNEAKRLVAKQISESAFGSDTYTTNKLVRNSLQKGIEDGASKLGLGDVNAINQEMAQMIRAQKLLKSLDNKPVKLSKFTKLKKGLIHSVKEGAFKAAGAGALYEGYKKIKGE